MAGLVAATKSRRNLRRLKKARWWKRAAAVHSG